MDATDGSFSGNVSAENVEVRGQLSVGGNTQAAVMVASGVATLGGAGSVVVANPLVLAGSRFVLTANDGGAALTGSLQQTARVANTSFTIASSAGAGDAGVKVYWQQWTA